MGTLLTRVVCDPALLNIVSRDLFDNRSKSACVRADTRVCVRRAAHFTKAALAYIAVAAEARSYRALNVSAIHRGDRTRVSYIRFPRALNYLMHFPCPIWTAISWAHVLRAPRAIARVIPRRNPARSRGER